jgi:hypothetical protein
MLLGIDFDNTIVSYDRLFHGVACEAGLIPVTVAVTKEAVRQCLIQRGDEDAWTQLQGHVYGTRMLEALPFPGVIDFFYRCNELGIGTVIVSHKTRYPYQGPQHDLHGAAHGWLEYHGFYDPRRINLGQDRVFFELSKREKLVRIGQLGCSHFIDDLPDILAAHEFPDNVERLLFDPNGQAEDHQHLTRMASWEEIDRLVLCENGVPK